MIIDSDVLIWFLRGNPKAKKQFNKASNKVFSAVTRMELIQGMRDKRELSIFNKTLIDWNAEVILIDERITSKAISLMESFFLSHCLEMADALIGATCILHGHSLLTCNTKHYDCIESLELISFEP